MKYQTPEISWHNKDPVLSIDIQPVAEEFYRLASGGTDSHVVIWYLRRETDEKYIIEAVSDLTKHQRSVNVVRWSPCTNFLASGDDDGNIILWHRKADELAVMLNEDTNKEKWSIFKILRGHTEDVYDISWSKDSKNLVSGSVDNTAIVWDVAKGSHQAILTEHKGFVQGVCWDPLGKYIATLCSDRICRIYSSNGKYVRHRVSKGKVPVPDTHPLYDQTVRYYHDDTLKSYFRRLTFSPDGLLLITPCGLIEMEEEKLYTSYIHTRNNFVKPAIVLPCPQKFTIAARCCPLYFELRKDGPDPIIDLPYRMIIAIATSTAVVLYDTQQTQPFALISNIHYTRLTDLSWSPDARLLMVSSSDGFCSLITFKENELGTVYQGSTELSVTLDELEEEITETTTVVNTPEVSEEKNISTLKKWTLKKPKVKKSIEITVTKNEMIQKDDNDVEIIQSDMEIKVHTEIKQEKNTTEDVSNDVNKENINNKISTSENKPNQTSSKQKQPKKIVPTKVNSITPKRIIPKRVSSEKPSVIKSMEISENNSEPPKPITPNKQITENQMNIKSFLKTPKEEKNEKKRKSKKNHTANIQMSPVDMVEENARHTWNDDSQLAAKISKMSPTVVTDIITIEDSQDIKLVLEDTTVGESKQGNLNNCDKTQKEAENKLILKGTAPITEKNTEINCDEKNNEISPIICDKSEGKLVTKKLKISKEKNSENCASIPHGFNIPSTSKTILSDSIKTTNSSHLTDCKVSNNQINSNLTKNSSIDVNTSNDPIVKKKVPFFTLSSPKTKKKPPSTKN